MSWVLIVTALYVGSLAPGQSSLRIETHLGSAHECNKAGAKWQRSLSYLGAREIEIQCKAMGR